MKKTLLFVCALLALCLCGNAFAEADIDAQLALMASLPNLGVDTTLNPWNYVVTDLDRNGRLELITATLQGTGLYTYLNAYEVSEDGSELVPVELMWGETDSAPDICIASVPAWEDAETGRMTIVVEDITRNGYAETYLSQRAVYYEDGKLYADTLASGSLICSDINTCEESYTAAAGNTIDGEEYAVIGSTTFGKPADQTLPLNWQMLDTDVPVSVADLRAALSLFETAD